jgi:Flp pilus assembly protein CpaB
VQNYRGRGQISIPYLLTIGVAVLLTVVLAARQVTRTGSARVVAARRSIRAGEKIDASGLGFASIPKSAVPPGAVLDPAAIIGRVLQRPVTEGKAITATDFVPSTPVMWLSDTPPAGRVIITVSVPGTLLPVQQLRTGDQMELLAVTSAGHSHIVARDAYLIGSIMGKREPAKGNTIESLTGRRDGPTAVSVVGLVLAVRPEDASPVAQAQGVGERLTFVLHGRQEILSGHLLNVPGSQARQTTQSATPAPPPQVELISGSHRERINVN